MITNNVIGLFGTCGGSKWRDDFISTYNELGIEYYNPLTPNWKPENAAIEAYHMMNDAIILFPVTDETYGAGSLAEIGFSILTTIKRLENRFVIIYVADEVDHTKVDVPHHDTIKSSNNARALVKAHLKENPHSNVFVVESLDEMKKLSLILHAASFLLIKARNRSLDFNAPF